MPTVLIMDGFRFYFYSEEGNEPIHIHVAYGNGRGKFRIKPDVILANSIGFSAKEIKRAKKLIQENHKLIEDKWNEYDRRRKNP